MPRYRRASNFKNQKSSARKWIQYWIHNALLQFASRFFHLWSVPNLNYFLLFWKQVLSQFWFTVTSLKIGKKVNLLCSMVWWNWLRMVPSFNDFNSICFAATETRIKGRLPFFKLRDIVVLWTVVVLFSLQLGKQSRGIDFNHLE